MKSLHFHIPEAWKRYPFPAEPSNIGHHREYPHPTRLCTYLLCGELFKEQSVCLWYWSWIRLRSTQGQVLLLMRKVTAQVIYSIFFKLRNITWNSEVFCGTQYFPAKPTAQKTARSAGKLAIKNSRKQRAKGECPLAGSSRLTWRGCLLAEGRSIFPFPLAIEFRTVRHVGYCQCLKALAGLGELRLWSRGLGYLTDSFQFITSSFDESSFWL